MADLDDFFAKKDRKKSKSVKKFSTTDEVAKKLEDTKQKSDVRPKKERPPQEGEEGGRAGEEEWKEYQEPVKDYTGLKLQVLQGGAAASERRESISEDAANDAAKGKGPWNKPQSEQSEAPPQPPPPKEERPKEPPKTTAYVPPVARNRPAEPLRRTNAASKNAPDIHNDDFFPQLGASGGGKRGGGWSTAGGGGAAPRPAARQPLALGNRFTELQDDS